ncbi:MAG: hypothetical protein JWN32_4375 [Solirubrobacterales bacterium]|nr:hypothetical protein [Solirubrobacterales bacterium]
MAACVALVGAAPATAALHPLVEAANFSKTLERQSIYLTPQYQLKLRTVGLHNALAALHMGLADPEREFATDLCSNGMDGCAGDVRLYDWQRNGYGIVKPVLFTARNGATLSGHVWATRAGSAAPRPGVVITNGSVQADEQMYWFAAQALAKAGYVVLTFDPQGQGLSDTFGTGRDLLEGTPAQTDGRPFYDGTEDALNFFFSTRAHPYDPVKSCSSGTSHADKQNRRAAKGLDAPYNPFWSLLDPSRVGIAGHSYGAAGVSYIGQWDSRVKAIVAWDNLGPPDPNKGLGERPCPADPTARTAAATTKPALGMSADYGLPPTPNLTTPKPLAKSTASLAYTKAGVDTGEIVIRGGSHLDFSFIPNPAFGASLRGADEIAWYTTAWFDKYVKGDPTADARLLTNRWRHDGEEAAVDPKGDGNMFSFYYRSRLDVHLAGGGRFACEDLRPGCPGLTDADGVPGVYSYVALARSPDHDTTSARAAAVRPRGRADAPCCRGRRRSP